MPATSCSSEAAAKVCHLFIYMLPSAGRPAAYQGLVYYCVDFWALGHAVHAYDSRKTALYSAVIGKTHCHYWHSVDTGRCCCVAMSSLPQSNRTEWGKAGADSCHVLGNQTILLGTGQSYGDQAACGDCYATCCWPGLWCSDHGKDGLGWPSVKP